MTSLVVSIDLMFFQPSKYEICSRAYRAFLLRPWKLLTFFAALALITVVAPYSGDPTWDYPDSLIISCLSLWGSKYSLPT
jgi:hypothetical protein